MKIPHTNVYRWARSPLVCNTGPECNMKIPGPLLGATLLRRDNRFVVEEKLNRRVILACLRNSRRLPRFLLAGKEVPVHPLGVNGKRKTEPDLLFVKEGRYSVSVDSTLPNRPAAEAISCGEIAPLRSFRVEKAEARFNNCRFYLLLTKNRERLLVEVKSVTLVEGDKALFPDSPTIRGGRHLQELIRLKGKGWEAGMVFAVMHGRAKSFSSNWMVDPHFSKSLSQAARKGVLVSAYRFRTTRGEIAIDKRLPIVG